MKIDLSIAKSAIFSEDRKYRYALWRSWNRNRPAMMCIGLNPSTANEISDDPTITRMIKRADNSGYGALLMGNLFALVSTKPEALLTDFDYAVGESTDKYLKQMIELSEVQLCGWGSFKPVWLRYEEVHKMLKNPVCLGINSDSQPKHPLYIGYDVPMMKYETL